MKNGLVKHIRRLFAGVLTGVMVVTLFPATLEAATVEATVAAHSDDNGVMEKMNTDMLSEVKSFDRQKINFNREWKFIRKDIENAKNSDYDDSNWFNVGLPHDFSIPYYQETKHFTGYGWYRKSFEYDSSWTGKRVNLEFDGVFHTAEVYVNDNYVGEHEGGYTGFSMDITDYLKTGQNIVAIRVNNVWKEDMAPRTGEHNFTGGIYRDVNLVVTSPVHVTWNGTFAQTPDISKESSKLSMQAEVKNECSTALNVKVVHTLYDKENKEITKFASASQGIGAGETVNFNDESLDIANPHLWSPDDPYMYKVVTDVYVGDTRTDSYETEMGFRWMEWTSDQGFFLNGEHLWINGANVHQDHAGWANAVAQEGTRRDIAMVKEAGLNFIRGSHYPHSPTFAQTCDEMGLLFWSECDFWGTYASGEGGANGNSQDYLSDSYPTTGDKEVEARFEQSCLKQLEEMIRINRNHPCIIAWSMGNEVFFGDNHDKKKALLTRMGALAKELDPTRQTAMGGTQVGGYDKVKNIDIAGYNGDGGGSEYHDPGVPSMASEYSTHTGNRPEKFTTYYNNLELDENGDPMQYPWRSGVSLWCAFHHGSIMSRSYGDMGFIDYYRLPLQIWYYYRWMNTGVEEEHSIAGTASKLSLEASDLEITNDGTKDTHIIVTVQDEDGNWVNDEPEVIFEVEEGPGIFPNGKSQTFVPGDSMRDGKAAIEFRSYYVGTTVIKAYSPTNPELGEARITITTTGNSTAKEPDITKMYGSFMSNGGMIENSVEEPSLIKYHNYNGSQTWASAGELTRRNIQDGNPDTEWVADAPGNQWIYFEQEHGGINLYKAQVLFKGKVYPYRIQYKSYNLDEPEWITLKEYDKNTIADRPYEENIGGVYMRYFRVEFTGVPANEYARIAEVKLYGIRAMTEGYKLGMKDLSELNAAQTDNALVYDLAKDAPGYTRFQCNAKLKSDMAGKDTLVQVYCDDELMYEKHLTDSKDVADIDISVNNVKKLKLVAVQNNANVLAVDWESATLIGAIRDISFKDSKLKVQMVESSGTLKLGSSYDTELRIINNSENTADLAIGIGLYRKDGTLISSSMELLNIDSNKEKDAFNGIMIPTDFQAGGYVRLMVWDKASLVPVAEIINVARDTDVASTPVTPDNGRDVTALCEAIKQAYAVINASDAGKYTMESRKNFTETLFAAVTALNNMDAGKEQTDAAAQSVMSAIAGLTLVPQGSDVPNVGPKPNVTPMSGGTVVVNLLPGKSSTGITGTTSELKKGKVIKAGKLKYKVISVKKGKVKVSVCGCNSKKLKNLSIPATVKLGGVKCQVAEVASKAFVNMKKLVKVSVGGNVTVIGAKAFYGCNSLKKVTITSTKLRKVGKKAFGKTNKKLSFKLPKKQKKAYMKIIK